MKLLGFLFIMLGTGSMFYDTFVYSNININGTIIFFGILILWYSIRNKKNLFINF